MRVAPERAAVNVALARPIVFVNAAALDFRLEVGSPAVDDADPTTVPAVDFAGVTRPRGAGPDIGAFESH